MKKTTATNKRNFFYKYYNINDDHNLAVPAGRCECKKITDIFCDKCNTYVCEKHIWTNEQESYCEKCKTEDSRLLTNKEKRKIKKAKLKF